MKIKPYFILFLIICFSILYTSCNKNKPPTEIPDDFNFVIRFNHAFSVDTHTNTLTETDLYDLGNDYSAEFHFTEEQMKNIYSELLRLRIYQIENGTDVGEINTIPPMGVYFTYTFNGETIAILCSDTYIPSPVTVTKEKSNFVEFTNFIISYIDESEEYKNAPHIFYGWE